VALQAPTSTPSIAPSGSPLGATKPEMSTVSTHSSTPLTCSPMPSATSSGVTLAWPCERAISPTTAGQAKAALAAKQPNARLFQVLRLDGKCHLRTPFPKFDRSRPRVGGPYSAIS
jgi:hypothetical protein